MNLTLTKFLSLLKNVSLVKKELLILNFNKSYLPILNLLYNEGFILNYSKIKNKIIIRFRYYYNISGLKNIKIISTISKPIYLNTTEISKIYRKNKLLVFSTSKGFLTSTDCQRLKIGGILMFIC